MYEMTLGCKSGILILATESLDYPRSRKEGLENTTLNYLIWFDVFKASKEYVLEPCCFKSLQPKI